MTPISQSSPAVPATDLRVDHGTRVVVFGATGYIGAHLVPRLLREGYAVRASGRNRKVLDARDWSGVESVEADALMPESLEAALAGVDIAYYLVHSMAAGQDFGRLDVEAADNFAAAGVFGWIYRGRRRHLRKDEDPAADSAVRGDSLSSHTVIRCVIRVRPDRSGAGNEQDG